MIIKTATGIERYLPDGFAWGQFNEQTNSDLPVSIRDPYAELPLADAISYAKTHVDIIAAEKRNSVVVNVSPAEMASWTIKYNEAAAYVASSNTADAPKLLVEATARGISLDTLAQKVITKGDALSALEANISGVAGKHCDAISALTTPAAVAAYDYFTGWAV